MSFDLLAPHYRWMEFLLAGEKLQRCRTAFLDRISGAERVLIIGEGNGRFLVECRRRLPGARIVTVDASARMLGLARARLARLGLGPSEVEFLRADVREWRPPTGAFDLVVTHFVLDCFPPEQVEVIVARLARGATPRASWLVSDFTIPTEGLLRHRAKLILGLMYLFFRAVCQIPAHRLTPPDSPLRGGGFALRERRLSEWGLLQADWWTRG